MQITPSLELCQKMKELGYPQDAHHFIWCLDYDGYWFITCKDVIAKEIVVAPTVEEMVEWLKVQKIDGEMFLTEMYNRFMEWGCSIRVWVNYDPIQTFHAETLSNAVAKAVIWVLEQEKKWPQTLITI